MSTLKNKKKYKKLFFFYYYFEVRYIIYGAYIVKNWLKCPNYIKNISINLLTFEIIQKIMSFKQVYIVINNTYSIYNYYYNIIYTD